MAKATFTPSFVARATCPPDKQRVFYSDTAMKGFVLEVRQSGGMTYYLRHRDPYGAQRNIKIGDAKRLSLSDAREAFRHLYGMIAMGRDPQEEKKARRDVPTLSFFIQDRYLPYVKGYKRSWISDERLLRCHVTPVLGNRRIDALTTSDIYKLHHKMLASGLAPATCNRVLVLVRYVFNLAIRWGIPGITQNPSVGVPLFQVNNERQRFLTREEIARLMSALRESPNQELLFIVSFLLLTGARRSEALNAEWNEIDFGHRVWVIPISKSGRARKVQLSDTAIDLLRSLPSHGRSPFLFPNPATGKPYVAVHNAWDTARKKAGLADVRMHDLRHSFASFLVNSGRSLYEVQRLLGHAHIKVTQRYAHLSDETLSNAVNVAASFVTLEGTTAEEGEAPAVPLISGPRVRTRPRPSRLLEGASQP